MIDKEELIKEMRQRWYISQSVKALVWAGLGYHFSGQMDALAGLLSGVCSGMAVATALRIQRGAPF